MQVLFLFFFSKFCDKIKQIERSFMVTVSNSSAGLNYFLAIINFFLGIYNLMLI